MPSTNYTIVIQERGTRVITRRLNKMGEAATGVQKAMQFLRRALVVVASAVVLQRFAQFVDTLTQIQNRLRLVTEGVQNLNVVSDRLLEISNRTRTAFEANAEVYTRVALSTRDLGISQQTTLDFVDRLNKAIIISGASAQEAQAGIIQLTQGLASDRLSGDELRSVLEQLPRVAQVIADGLGVTRGELRDLGEQGKITGEVILDAFEKAGAELDAEFATTVPTIGQALQVLRNQVIETIGRFNDFVPVLTATSKAITTLAAALPNLVLLFGALGLALLITNFGLLSRGVLLLARQLNLKLGVALAKATIGMRRMDRATFRLNRRTQFLAKRGITPLTRQLQVLFLLLAKNPFVLLGVAIAGAVGLLARYRNSINISSESSATLGDAVTAAGERFSFLNQVVEDFRIIIPQVFDELADEVDGFSERAAPAVADFLDKTITLTREGFEGLQEIFGKNGGNAGAPVDPTTFFRDILGRADEIAEEREARLAAAAADARNKEIRLVSEYIDEVRREIPVLLETREIREQNLDLIRAEEELRRRGIDLADQENQLERERVRRAIQRQRLAEQTAAILDQVRGNTQLPAIFSNLLQQQQEVQRELREAQQNLPALEVELETVFRTDPGLANFRDQMEAFIADPSVIPQWQVWAGNFYDLRAGIVAAREEIPELQRQSELLARALRLVDRSITANRQSFDDYIDSLIEASRIEGIVAGRSVGANRNYLEAYQQALRIRDAALARGEQVSDAEFNAAVRSIQVLLDRNEVLAEVQRSLNAVVEQTFDFTAAEAELDRLVAAGTITLAQRTAALEDLRNRLNATQKSLLDVRLETQRQRTEDIRLAQLGNEERERELEIERQVAAFIELNRQNGRVFREQDQPVIDERARIARVVDYLNLLEQVNGAVDGVQGSTIDLEAAQTELNRQLEAGNVTVDDAENAYRQLRIEALAASRTFEGGFERGLLKLQDDIGDLASAAENAIVGAFRGMEDALVNFVTTGEFNFANFANAIIADIARIAVQQAIIGPLLGLLVPGGGFAAAAGAAAAGARALGGPVTGGQPYLVGERGPELFVPPTGGGSIQPNGGQGGGGVRIINVVDPEAMGDYLSSPSGEKIVMNHITKNKSAVRQAVGG